MESKQYDYLNEEREKIWQVIEELRNSSKGMGQDIADIKDDVKKKTSDYEAEAKNAAKQTATSKTKASNILNEAKRCWEELNDFFNDIKAFKESIPEITKLYDSVKDKESEVSALHETIQGKATKIINKQEEVNSELQEAGTSLAEAQGASEEINKLKGTIESLHQKTTMAHGQAVKKNTEIKGLYDEIFGYTYEDVETGEEKTVNGTKQELAQAYEALDREKEELSVELVEFKEKVIKEHEDFFALKNKETDELKEKIRSLLPEAMTAGLSHAYEKKRKGEEIILGKAKTTFKWAIVWLSLTSVIPIAFSIYFIQDGKTVSEVILDLPRLVFSILPIYMPLFWFALTANKSVKLSKRLIEEYSHKESLSKTFEGLSTQINNLDDDGVSRDLRMRLLYNIISASSENPGKLIKDFHTSDNPILNVLNQSLSFSKSLEKLSAIPGIEVVLQKVVKNQEQTKDVIAESVETSVAASDIIENCGQEDV